MSYCHCYFTTSIFPIVLTFLLELNFRMNSENILAPDLFKKEVRFLHSNESKSLWSVCSQDFFIFYF